MARRRDKKEQLGRAYVVMIEVDRRPKAEKSAKMEAYRRSAVEEAHIASD